MAKRKLFTKHGRRVKRRYRKPRKIRRRRRLIIGGIPRSKTVKLRWVHTANLDAGLDACNFTIYRANGPYDPVQAVGGDQPRGWDNFASEYNHYKVLGSKIKVQWVSDDIANTTPSANGILMSTAPNAITTATTLPNLLNRRDCTAAIQSGINGAPGKYNSRTMYFSNRKEFRNQSMTSNVLADTTGLPQEEMFFYVWTAALNGNNPGQVHFIVTLDYIVKFSDPKSLPIDA